MKLAALVLVGAAFVAAGCGAAHHAASPSGANVDLSREAGTQAETRIAIDPRNPSVLLVGAIDPSIPRMVAYTSTDAGRAWTTTALQLAGDCVFDPAVAIDRRGREYYAFLAHPHCERGGHAHVYVATRDSPTATWRIPRRPVATYGPGVNNDDRPALLVDNGERSRFAGRLYIAWTRLRPAFASTVLVAHSDDGGSTWSRAVDTHQDGEETALAVAPDGTLYLAFTSEDRAGMFVLRSADGGASFAQQQQILTQTLATGPVRGQLRCRDFAGTIPALPKTCVRPDPSVVVVRGHVVVTYGARKAGGGWGVFAAGFTPRLRPVFGGGGLFRVKPAIRAARASDQFQAVSTVDTGAVVWTCFYDTTGDLSRRTARWSCASSADGGHTWTKPTPTAAARSDETHKGADPFAYGDYEGIAASEGNVATAWTDDREPGATRDDIFTAWVARAPK